jgi:hypothetical protein
MIMSFSHNVFAIPGSRTGLFKFIIAIVVAQ